MSKKNRQQQGSEARASERSSTGFIDWFESLGNHGVWVVLGLASLMTAWIYLDFLTAAKVLLYKDIGSDSINIFYPQWVQWTKLWETYGATSGYSLETVMGQGVGFNVWSPFDWIIATGGTANIASNIAYIEMLKAIVTTTLGYFFFRYQSYANITSAIGALCLGFAGYIALGASGWYVHSGEAMWMVLALWLSEYGLNKKPFYYVVIPVLTAYLTMMTGYLAIYLAAALVVYILVRNYTTLPTRESLVRSAMLIGIFVVGFALSYNTLTSVLSMITSSGRVEAIKSASSVSTYGTKMDVSMLEFASRAEYSNIILRAYSNNTMGSGSNFRGMMNYLEAPLLYYGLPMLLFLPFFWVGQDKRTRIVYGALLGLVVMLLLFPWFRFAFWGFNLDYFREYTMLIGVVMLILAMRGLNTFVTISNKSFTWLAPASALFVVILPFAIAKPATLIDPSQKSTLIALILGYGAVATAYALTKRKDILIGLLALTSIDLALNANTTINKRDMLTTREIDQGALYGGSSKKAIDWIKSQQSGLYRVVKFNPSGPTIHVSLNDAMVQGFHGIVGYSSFHNKYYLRAMEAFGCRDPKNPSEAKWVVKAITRPYLASALGVKYFLVNDKPMGFNDVYFPAIQQVDNVFVHESKVALPLLVAYDSYITEDEFRTQREGRNDYMLYRAVTLAPEVASKLSELRHYDLSADTLRLVSHDDFARAAEERKGLMSVQAKTSKDGINAEVDLKRDALVVVAIPYDESLTVTVDGKPAASFVSNVGFVGVRVPSGKHSIAVLHDSNK